MIELGLCLHIFYLGKAFVIIELLQTAHGILSLLKGGLCRIVRTLEVFRTKFSQKLSFVYQLSFGNVNSFNISLYAKAKR